MIGREIVGGESRPIAIVGSFAVHRDPTEDYAAIDVRRPGMWAVLHVPSNSLIAGMLDLQIARDLAWTLAKYMPEVGPKEIDDTLICRGIDPLLTLAGIETAALARMRQAVGGERNVALHRQHRLYVRDRLRDLARSSRHFRQYRDRTGRRAA